MKLVLIRNIFTEESTIGELFTDSNFQCYTLEDMDRSLSKEMSLDEIKEKKQYGKTAIPTGIYDVLITDSNRFKRPMPLIASVPGFEGIRIHAGNTSADTEGCLLLGITKGFNYIGQSKVAFDAFFDKLKNAIATGDKCSIEIVVNKI